MMGGANADALPAALPADAEALPAHAPRLAGPASTASAVPPAPLPSLLRHLLACTPAVFVVYVRDPSDGAFRYVEANASACRALGRVRADVVGRTNTELFGAEAAPLMDDFVVRCCESRADVPCEHALPTPGDGVRIFDTTYTYCAAEGREYVFGTCHDVTDEREQRRRSEALLATAEHATRTKALFLARMSHDLRTPLMGVVSAAEVLASDARLDAEQAEMVRVIRSSANALQALSGDITDLTGVDHAPSAFTPRAASLKAMLRDVAGRFAHLAARAGVSLRVEAVDGGGGAGAGAGAGDANPDVGAAGDDDSSEHSRGNGGGKGAAEDTNGNGTNADGDGAVADVLPERVLQDLSRVRQVLSKCVLNALSMATRGCSVVVRVRRVVRPSAGEEEEEAVRARYLPAYLVEHAAGVAAGGGGKDAYASPEQLPRAAAGRKRGAEEEDAAPEAVEEGKRAEAGDADAGDAEGAADVADAPPASKRARTAAAVETATPAAEKTASTPAAATPAASAPPREAAAWRLCWLQFDVVDDGAGLTEAQKAQVFQPFAQVPEASSYGGAGWWGATEIAAAERRDEGGTKELPGDKARRTGLEMAIAHGLCQALGGRLELVYSELGEGSDFRATLPFLVVPPDEDKAGGDGDGGADVAGVAATAAADGAADGADGGADAGGGREGAGAAAWMAGYDADAPEGAAADQELVAALPRLRLLIAEDHALSRRVLVRLLRSWVGVSDVTTVIDGREAVEMVMSSRAAGKPFDVVLMDVEMPRMGGIDAVNAIREAYGGGGGGGQVGSWGRAGEGVSEAEGEGVAQAAAAGSEMPYICMLSANATPKDVDACYSQCKPDCYLTKPMKGAELRQMLCAALRQRRA